MFDRIQVKKLETTRGIAIESSEGESLLDRAGWPGHIEVVL
jgi:hypothetical protein